MTRNPILRLTLILFALASLVACKKHQEKPNPALNPNPSIYITEVNENSAVYWKDGISLSLSNGTEHCTANQLAVGGGNVYIAGGDINAGDDAAVCWKQGAPDFLQLRGGTISSVANSVFISGSDVYTAGWTIANNNLYATWWQNGKAAVIDSTNSGQCYSIAVADGHVYIAGLSLYNKANTVATYWKDGVRQILMPGGDLSYAYSICVAGGDVYIAGAYQKGALTVPALWKNGQLTDLYNNNGVALSVTVAGDDVYVGGYEDVSNRNTATIWKNGVAQQLPGGSQASFGGSVYVYGNDVYFAGGVESSGVQQACYWKNGQLKVVGDAGSSATSIVVQ